MNCNTCRYQLSLCLDGRLPSGRHAIVMQHVAACEACETFRNELHAAQQLTLQMPRTAVSKDFHERLWDRIRAGEGTPDAVFHEPVPLISKLRYTLTGAAAAAAALLCLTWMREERAPLVEQQTARLAPHDSERVHPSAIDIAKGPAGDSLHATRSDALVARDALKPIDQAPLFASMQRLRFDILAVETAKQLEQRYDLASRALGRLDDDGSKGAGTGRDIALRQVFDNADELHSFGELLLDLRTNGWLFFTDAEVGADLRLAVDLLGEVRSGHRDRATALSLVAPALRSSRLGNVSRSISLKPLDPHQEMDLLVRVNRQNPDVLPKLFIVFGTDEPTGDDLDLLRSGTAFVMDGQCGPSWVAPRSEVEARNGRLQMLSRLPGAAQITVQPQANK